MKLCRINKYANLRATIIKDFKINSIGIVSQFPCCLEQGIEVRSSATLRLASLAEPLLLIVALRSAA